MNRVRKSKKAAPTAPESPAPQGALTVSVHARIADLEADFAQMTGFDEAPFLRYAFLSAFEDTGCVRPQRGWAAHHIAVKEGDRVVAIAPTYLKGNSEGEFVFDHAFANAAPRFGVDYYPKLLVAVPFTPANGRRVLVREGFDEDLAHAAVAEALRAIVEDAELSSSHVLFLPEARAQAFAARGFIHRVGVQFHFRNQGFTDFEGFLTTLPSKRRTQLRRERRAASEQGLTLSIATGDALTPALADAMYDFYVATVDKFYWGRRYLNRAFFEAVFASPMREHIDVVTASNARGEPIAGAFNLRSKTALFGRYWGAKEEHPFLHFNVCYYQGIERSIALGLAHFEPGAGGEHKLVRGFAPTLTHSVHHLRDRRFHHAIADAISRERSAIEAELLDSKASS